jgi:hypothetical protein
MTTQPVPYREMNYEDPKTWNVHAKRYDDAVGLSSRLGATHLISLAESLDPSLSNPDARAIE